MLGEFHTDDINEGASSGTGLKSIVMWDPGQISSRSNCCSPFSRKARSTPLWKTIMVLESSTLRWRSTMLSRRFRIDEPGVKFSILQACITISLERLLTAEWM